MTRTRTALASLTAVAAGALLALLPAAAASAHDYLVDSSPAAGSTVTKSLDTVSLTFNDIVLDLSGDGESSIMQVTGPDKRHFETGCTKTLGRTVSVPVSLGGAGTYDVTWQIVSADGHTVSGTIQFTYDPPAGAVKAAGSEHRPACGAGASGTSAASAAPASGTKADSSELGIVIGIASAIIALAVIAVVVVLVTARRRPAKPASTGSRAGTGSTGGTTAKPARKEWRPDDE
ncbi:copper resistance protein CopC [Microbacterium sp. STN6]|uniref:copper resistance CopC family protein n=1 Tax=Microbacterium sp. STN6 TaxID=2995588 RepID=UPI002260A034|nr:copper resistance CopC family protein [Microbacterium sp. STN6]MCX7523010.1 copper resistance protein CopC [Microbacterium sp. STN6]